MSKPEFPSDLVAQLTQLDPGSIAERLDEIEAEAAVLRALQKAAAGRAQPPKTRRGRPKKAAESEAATHNHSPSGDE